MDTRKIYDANVWRCRDFLSIRESSRHESSTRNRGYDIVNNGLLSKCVTKKFYNDENFSTFLNSIDKIIIHFTNCIKQIQFSNNYIMKDNDFSINL